VAVMVSVPTGAVVAEQVPVPPLSVMVHRAVVDTPTVAVTFTVPVGTPTPLLGVTTAV